MYKTVTMKDIAGNLGVSIVTVSKALTEKEGVGEELRATIKETARNMGYHYGATSKGNKSGRNGSSHTIGVLVASNYVGKDTDAFYLKMYQSMVLNLSKNNYSAILELIHPQMQQNSVLPHIILDHKVDGIIVLGQLTEEYLECIKNTAYPVVYLDFYDRDMMVDSVTTDSVYGTYILTNYVIGMGHEKIAFVGDIHATDSILDRYLGYCRSLFVHNRKVREDYLIKDRDAQGLFIDLILPADMPTAFVCNCDAIAYVLMEKLEKEGYKVPEDISVVGFDNYTFTGYAASKLTTIEVNIDAMAQTATDSLIYKIKGGQEKHGRKVISGTLIIRDSVSNRKENKLLHANMQKEDKNERN